MHRAHNFDPKYVNGNNALLQNNRLMPLYINSMNLTKRDRRNGIHTIEAAAELGIGSREYELIEF